MFRGRLNQRVQKNSFSQTILSLFRDGTNPICKCRRLCVCVFPQGFSKRSEIYDNVSSYFDGGAFSLGAPLVALTAGPKVCVAFRFLKFLLHGLLLDKNKRPGHMVDMHRCLMHAINHSIFFRALRCLAYISMPHPRNRALKGMEFGLDSFRRWRRGLGEVKASPVQPKAKQFWSYAWGLAGCGRNCCGVSSVGNSIRVLYLPTSRSGIPLGEMNQGEGGVAPLKKKRWKRWDQFAEMVEMWGWCIFASKCCFCLE